MDRPRNPWAFRRGVDAIARRTTPNHHVEGFRSDNDLRQLRFEWPVMLALFGVSASLTEVIDLPWRLVPLTLVPSIAFLIVSRWRARRDRRLGRRFGHYDGSLEG